MNSVNEKLLAELTAKDDLAFKLGDTLDVKASIGLVVITFLGTQTAYFLDKHISGISHALQAASVVSLVIATIFSIMELWPQKYLMIEPEENSTSRIPELIAHYSKYDEEVELNVLGQLILEEIQWTNQRIAANKSKNGRKAAWLEWAFRTTAIAIGLNAATLVLVWFTHPF